MTPEQMDHYLLVSAMFWTPVTIGLYAILWLTWRHAERKANRKLARMQETRDFVAMRLMSEHKSGRNV